MGTKDKIGFCDLKVGMMVSSYTRSMDFMTGRVEYIAHDWAVVRRTDPYDHVGAVILVEPNDQLHTPEED